MVNLFPIAADEHGRPDPELSARAAPDEYVVKIVLEATQMLVSAYRRHYGERPYALSNAKRAIRRRKNESSDSPRIMEAARVYERMQLELDKRHASWTEPMMLYAASRWRKMNKARRSKIKLDDQRPYRGTHWNHPMTQWAFASRHNFEWTARYALALCDEHIRRPVQSKGGPTDNKCRPLLEWMLECPPALPDKVGLTDMPACVDDDLKQAVVDGASIVDVYQEYMRRKRADGVVHWTRQPKSKPAFLTAQ